MPFKKRRFPRPVNAGDPVLLPVPEPGAPGVRAVLLRQQRRQRQELQLAERERPPPGQPGPADLRQVCVSSLYFLKKNFFSSPNTSLIKSFLFLSGESGGTAGEQRSDYHICHESQRDVKIFFFQEFVGRTRWTPTLLYRVRTWQTSIVFTITYH